MSGTEARKKMTKRERTDSAKHKSAKEKLLVAFLKGKS